MAATDLPDLFQFEKHFEDAAAVFLFEGVGIDVFASAYTDDFTTPRLEIQFTSGEAELPFDAPITSVPALAAGEFRKYSAEFFVRIITDPTAGQTRDDHFEYVGKTRVALLRSQESWDETTLPYYGLKWIRQTATDRDVDGDFQVTSITYEIRFAIKDDAFPTS